MMDRKVEPLDDQADFVLSFVEDSDKKREPMEEIWDEVEQNFLVRPTADVFSPSNTRYPLDGNLGTTRSRSLSILKDPETHQAVMTIVSKIVLALFGEPGFVKGRAVGFEDIPANESVSKLLERPLGRHYMTWVEWIMSSGIFGTGIVKGYWEYREETRNVRSVSYDMFGMQESSFVPAIIPVYDDPCFSPVDIRDFYPDLGKSRLGRMAGCAEKIRMRANEALRLAEQGIYDKAAVLRAIERKQSMDSRDAPGRTGDQSRLGAEEESHPDFVSLVGYEYQGETPFRAGPDAESPEDGISRRVITVLAGETVRSKPWPRRLGYFDCRIMPRLGSFYGISPAEVIRYDQDFADTLKMMLADAVVHMTHPPILYNKNADIDMAKLRAWKPRVPIGADFSAGEPIVQVQYNPPIQPGFAMYQGQKQQMREASGALGVVQGLGLGVDRASATEANQTFQQAMDRPELFASVVEREYMPPVASYILELYQEFIPDGPEGMDELRKRVGDSAYPLDLDTLLLDYDVELVGTRIEGGRQQKVAAFREIAQAAANPMILQLVPWIPLLRKWFNDIGAHDIAAMVGNPEMVMINTMLTQIGGGGAAGSPGAGDPAANGNGAMPAQPPIGMLPEQTGGVPLQ